MVELIEYVEGVDPDTAYLIGVDRNFGPTKLEMVAILDSGVESPDAFGEAVADLAYLKKLAFPNWSRLKPTTKFWVEEELAKGNLSFEEYRSLLFALGHPVIGEYFGKLPTNQLTARVGRFIGQSDRRSPRSLFTEADYKNPELADFFSGDSVYKKYYEYLKANLENVPYHVGVRGNDPPGKILNLVPAGPERRALGAKIDEIKKDPVSQEMLVESLRHALTSDTTRELALRRVSDVFRRLGFYKGADATVIDAAIKQYIDGLFSHGGFKHDLLAKDIDPSRLVKDVGAEGKKLAAEYSASELRELIEHFAETRYEWRRRMVKCEYR